MSVLLKHWEAFSEKAKRHINQYIDQFGDGVRSDASDLVDQAIKQIGLLGSSAQSGHDEVCLLRAVHFLQMAYTARAKRCDKREPVLGHRDEGGYKLYSRGNTLFVGFKDAVHFRRFELTRADFNELLSAKRHRFIYRARRLLDGAKRVGSPLYYEAHHGQ